MLETDSSAADPIQPVIMFLCADEMCKGHEISVMRKDGVKNWITVM